VAIADGVAGVRGGGGAAVGVAGVAALAARLVVGVDARLLGFLARLRASVRQSREYFRLTQLS
jgi:hypothetical protein